MNAADDLALLARVTASLVVVVALAVLGARLMRRAGVRGGGAGLRVVERAGLSREASVAVVEVAGRGLVLGVTAHGVRLLTELEPGELERATAVPVDVPVTSGTLSLRGDTPSRFGMSARTDLPFGTLTSEGAGGRRPAGTGSVLDPRTWKQALEALRDLTARRR